MGLVFAVLFSPSLLYYTRASEEFCLPTAGTAGAGFIGLSSFFSIGSGSERNGTHNTSSFYATEHEEL